MSAQVKTMTQQGWSQELSHEWKRWIAENLILSNDPAALVGVLLQHGVSQELAVKEMDAAMNSPYFQGVRRVQNRVAKRDWVLNIEAKLDRIVPIKIERKHRLSREDFLEHYYRRNQPVIITGMLDDCAALKTWSLDYFQSRFADRIVEVQMERTRDPNYEMNSIAHKRQMPFGDYVDLVRSCGRSNDLYMTANNDSNNRKALNELWEEFPDLPSYLRTDQGKQGFFWLGPAGTLTPYHHDLTNNFMIQMIGSKRVKFIAPCHLPRLQNERHCFTPIDGAAIDLQRFPQMRDVPVLECDIQAGEILFLPVGWWHYVESLALSVTISATHFIWDNDFYTNYPSNHDF